jgi:FAD/FMN-containing dehydrogenase
MAASAAALFREAGVRTEILAGPEAQDVWRQSEERVHDRDGTLLTAATRPTDMAPLLDTLEQAAKKLGTAWTLSGRGAMGVVQILLTNDPARHEPLVRHLREAATRLGGRCSVERVAPGIDAIAEPNDAPTDAQLLMEAVKQQFDPRNVLPPLVVRRAEARAR